MFFVADFLPPVVATLIADIKEFTAKMDEAQGKMRETEAVGGSSMKGIAAGMAGAGGAVGLLGVAVAGVSTKLAMDFQTSMTQVQNSAGMTADQTKKLGDAFVNTMFKSEFSAQDMATAYATVAGQLQLLNRGTLTTKQSMDFMSAATDLATAKHLNLGSAVSSTMQIMKAFQTPIAQTSDVTNQLFIASSLTGQSVDTLSGQYLKMASKIGSVMPSLTDMNTLMIDMNQHGVGSGRIFTQMTLAISNMLNPSKKQSQALVDMIGPITDASGKFVGMQSVLQRLNPVMSQYGDNAAAKVAALTPIFGGAADAVSRLVSDSGGFQAASDALSNHTTVTQAAATAQKDLNTQIKTLESGTHDVLIKIGTAIVPQVQQILNAVMGQGGKGLAYDITLNIKQFVKTIIDTVKPTDTPSQGQLFGDLTKGAFQVVKDVFGGIGQGALAVGKVGAGALGFIDPSNKNFGNFGAAGSAFGSASASAGASLRNFQDLYGYFNKDTSTAGGRITANGTKIRTYLDKNPAAGAPIPGGPNANILPGFGGSTKPLEISKMPKVGIEGLIGTDVGNTGVHVKSGTVDMPKGVSISNAPQVHLSAAIAGGISTTANNSSHLAGIQGVRIATETTAQHAYHLAGIPGIRSSTSSTADNTSQIARALSKTNKVTVTARFT